MEKLYLHSFFFWIFVPPLGCKFLTKYKTNELRYTLCKNILHDSDFWQVFFLLFNSHHKRILDFLMLLVHWHTFTNIFPQTKPHTRLWAKVFIFFLHDGYNNTKNLEMNIQGHVAAIFIFRDIFIVFRTFWWMKLFKIFL